MSDNLEDRDDIVMVEGVPHIPLPAAADEIGTSRATLWRWTTEGVPGDTGIEIAAVQDNRTRRILVSLASVEALRPEQRFTPIRPARAG